MKKIIRSIICVCLIMSGFQMRTFSSGEIEIYTKEDLNEIRYDTYNSYIFFIFS